MIPRLYTRTHDEDEVVLIVQALDSFRSDAKRFNRVDLVDRCDAAMVRMIEDTDVVVPAR